MLCKAARLWQAVLAEVGVFVSTSSATVFQARAIASERARRSQSDFLPHEIRTESNRASVALSPGRMSEAFLLVRKSIS
jgi:hypothetical protein